MPLANYLNHDRAEYEVTRETDGQRFRDPGIKAVLRPGRGPGTADPDFDDSPCRPAWP